MNIGNILSLAVTGLVAGILLYAAIVGRKKK